MISLKQKMEIKNLPFSKLLKLELPALAISVIGIVEKHDPEVLQIKEVFDLLVAEEPQIKKLKARYGVHPLTLKLKPLRDQLMLYVSALRFQLKVAGRVSTPSTLGHVVALNLAVDAHLGDLKRSRNEEVVHQKIDEFLDVVRTTEELSEAVSSIGIVNLIDSLKATQSSVRRLLNERLALISQRPKEKSNEIAQPVISALKDLYKQIEVAQLKHTELDYKPLFDELNDLSNKYRNLMNIREAHNKKKAEAKKNGVETDDDIIQPEETGDVMTPDVLTATTERMIHPEVPQVSNNGANKDNNLRLAQEKSVAMTYKPKQHPTLNDED